MSRGAPIHRGHAGAVLAAILVLTLLGACRPATPDAAPAPAAPPDTTPADSGSAAPAPAEQAVAGPIETHWQCGDQRVAARFDNPAQTVTVVHDRGELVLPQAVSASGARYADANGNEFWTKGPGGTLTLSGAAARDCTEIADGG